MYTFLRKIHIKREIHIINKIKKVGKFLWQNKKRNKDNWKQIVKQLKNTEKKTVSFAVKYSAVDANQGNTLKAYLEQTGQSANSYIKALIKADLDAKGFNIDSITTIDMESLESNNDTDNSWINTIIY